MNIIVAVIYLLIGESVWCTSSTAANKDIQRLRSRTKSHKDDLRNNTILENGGQCRKRTKFHRDESGRWRRVDRQFSSWSAWGPCDDLCKQSRTRVCRQRVHCGELEQMETRPCIKSKCDPHEHKNWRRDTIADRSSDVSIPYYRNSSIERMDNIIDYERTFDDVYNAEEVFDDDFSEYDGDDDANIVVPQKRNLHSNGRSLYEEKARDRPYRGYGKWTKWSQCLKNCRTKRSRKCKRRTICGTDVIRESAYCYVEGTYCERWIKQKMKQADEKIEHFYSSKYNKLRNPKKFTDKTTMSNGVTKECGAPQDLKYETKAPMWSLLRIIGGRPTEKGKWPWQVVLINRHKEAFCGGTLISPRFVLTAAHCVRKRLHARIAEHDLSRHEGPEFDFRVQRSIIHPRYNPETVDNDIALLRLPFAVKEGQFVRFACLPRPGQQLPLDQQCTIIGWGKSKSTDQIGTNILHEAEISIVSDSTCHKAYWEYHITSNMFCAGHMGGRKDSCAGDSGGPILCRDKTTVGNPWTIFGITSFGEGCGRKGKLGIYTKLPNYIYWIRKVLKDRD